MNKIEEKLFHNLVDSLGFYIKDYYSNYLGKNKWIAILEKEDFIYAVITCNEKDCSYIYEEARQFLSINFSKKISLNLVVGVNDDYKELEEKKFNKLLYSLKEKQVVYSDESCKPLVSIIQYSQKAKITVKQLIKNNIVTYSLIAINIIAFIVTSIMSKNIFDIDPFVLLIMGAKQNQLIDQGQVWRFITSAFLHGGLIHIFFNMYSLKIIGSEVECVYGKLKYLIIYIISALGGSVFSYLFNPIGLSVGASGAIFGLLGAMITFGIRNRNIINKGYVLSLIKVVIINIFIGMTISNIDNAGHIGGLLLGGTSALILKNRKYSDIKEVYQ